MSQTRGGLFSSLRRLLDTGLDIVQTRLELVGTELEQEKLRLLGALWQGALALLLLGLALVCAIGFLVLMFWEGYRLPAVGGLTLLLAATGVWMLRRARAALRSPEGGMFALSLGELRRDRDGLADASTAAPAAPSPERPAAPATAATPGASKAGAAPTPHGSGSSGSTGSGKPPPP